MSEHFRCDIRRRRATSALLAAALVAATISDVAVPALAATPHAKTAVAAGTNGPLTVAQASAKAKSTGQSVIADASTTPTSVLTANPNGSLTLSQSAEPVRAMHNGSWANLDPTLHTTANRTVTANLTTDPITLSGGGSTPLATLTSQARTFSLTWPTTLPTPTLTGDTATYANVMPSVDLVVTVSSQGGFSDALVIKNAQAATNPALTTLHLGLSITPGLNVTTDAAGNMTAATSAGTALFTSPAALMWDSSSPASSSPAPNAIARSANTSPTPTSTATPSDSIPTSVSGPTAPGDGAHTAPIETTATSTGITLTPDQSLLTNPDTVYPVYEDPSVTPAPSVSTYDGWATVSEYFPNSNYWKNTPDPTAGTMQVGNSGSMWSRSLVDFQIPSSLRTATVSSAVIGITETYGASCTPEKVNLYAPSATLTSSNATWNDWNNNFGSAIDSATPADTGWSSSCPGGNVPFTSGNILNTVRSDLSGGKTIQTFGLIANSETSSLGWKKFQANTATLTITYDNPPAIPASPATSPGGPCQTGPAGNDVIGNDDVTFSVIPNDPDGGALTTTFTIDNAQGAQVASSVVTSTAGPSPTLAAFTIPRATMQTLTNANGTTNPYAYSWYTSTSDGTLTSPNSGGAGTQAQPCTFTYNPTGPAAPSVTAPSTATLGQPASFTITPGTGITSTAYTYQLNYGPSASITATGSAQTLTIPMTHVGTNTLSVYAVGPGGNVGALGVANFTVLAPVTPYADADINGDNIPDLLFAGTASNPGLWLAAGTGPGTVNTPVNIGANGTGVQSPGSSHDWADADILHGNFSLNNVQDTFAYYDQGSYATGGYLLEGTGDATPLSTNSGSDQSLTPGDLANFNNDNPTDLIAASNASQTADTGNPPDLIGIAGDSTSPSNNYELDLYTTGGADVIAGYEYASTLNTTSPDNTQDWNNYTLATAQPNGQTVLFALNTTTGVLYESTNPTNSATALIGTPGTWTTISTPWTSTTIPPLTSADVNTNGQIELWSVNTSDTTYTAYTLNTTTSALTQENTSLLHAPTHDWPLNDGTGTTAADIAGGSTNAATFSPTGAAWAKSSQLNGDSFVLGVNAANKGYLTLPNSLISQSTTLSISISFQTTTANDSGIMLSTGQAAPPVGNNGAMPVMYVGTDGRLYAQFWTGTINPIVTPNPVNDGMWHVATLVGAGSTQTLYLDGHSIGTHTGTIANLDPMDFAGGGVFNTLSWVNAPGNSAVVRDNYFTGNLADIQYTPVALTSAQVAANP